jgi:hypothetical protein
MRLTKLHLPHAHELEECEKLEKDTIHLLSRIVFRHMSSLVLFNIWYFCVGRREKADDYFEEALTQELVRRGLLKWEQQTLDVANLDKFTDYDMRFIKRYFDPDPDRPTREDLYVELLTGRTRWIERKRLRRAVNEAIAAADIDEAS